MISLIEITAEKNDSYLDAILEIEDRSFPSPWNRRAFLAELSNPISRLWGLIKDEQLVGYTCFWFFPDEIHILNIAVHPDARGQGVAQHLMQRIVDTAVSGGIPSIWLEMRPSNEAASRLYRRMGFEVVGSRKNYYPDTHEDAVIMALTLAVERHGAQI